jgi:hypothetical protein
MGVRTVVVMLQQKLKFVDTQMVDVSCKPVRRKEMPFFSAKKWEC